MADRKDVEVMTTPLPHSPHDRDHPRTIKPYKGTASRLFDDLTLLAGQICDSPVAFAIVFGENLAEPTIVAHNLEAPPGEASIGVGKAAMALYPKRAIITIADLYTMPSFANLTQQAGRELKFTANPSPDLSRGAIAAASAKPDLTKPDLTKPDLTKPDPATSQPLPTEPTEPTQGKAANNNLLAVNSPVRFFVGLRLFSPAGSEVGLLCVFDFQAKTLNDRQQQSLEALGRQATGMLRSLQAFGANLAQPIGEDIVPPQPNRVGFEKILRSLPSYQGIVDILERVTDAFLSVDDEWRLTYLNAHAAELWKIDRDMAIGHNLWMCFPGLQDTDFERYSREAVLQRRARQFEHFDTTLDCWLDVHVYPAPGRISIYFHDITKRKHSEEASFERAHTSALVTAVSAALGQSQPLERSLELCASALEHNLTAISVGIWLIDRDAIHPSSTTMASRARTIDDAHEPSVEHYPQLALAALSGEPFPEDLFPEHVAWGETTIGWVAQTPHPYCINQFGTMQPDRASRNAVSQDLPEPTPDIIPTYEFNERISQWVDQNYLNAVVCYPLVVESRPIGVLVLASAKTLPDNSHDILTWVANGIAIAVDRIWVRDSLSHRRKSLLFSLAGQIRNTLDLDTILSTAVREIRSLLHIDRCYYIWCAVETTMTVLAVTHEDMIEGLPSWLGDLPANEEARLSRYIIQLESVRIDDIANEDPDTQSVLKSMGIVSQLVLPLGTRAGQFGAIVCAHGSEARTWTNGEEELLHAAVDQLAIAIDQAELYAKTCAAALAAQTQAQQLQDAMQNLKQTEAQLVQNEKMSSLGQMVAGIAHEINNPVNFISGNLTHASTYISDLLSLIQLYQETFPDPGEELEDEIEAIELEFLQEDLPKLLDSMRMGADRIREIVLSLRNFSRLDEAEMKPVKLDEGIDSTLLILQSRLKGKGGNGIEVVKHYADLPPVDCYPGSLNQVFMNLLANAIDAEDEVRETEGDRPSITITTEPIGSDDDAQVPDRVRVTIADNGSGIPENIVKQLFDPFFTTKPVGKGTGLGLSISYQIVVDQHGGKLWCESEVGRGTSFFVEIPVRQEEAN
jgi:PAS domain S-box-containing protein